MRKKLLCFTLVGFLAGCGGGGSSSTPDAQVVADAAPDAGGANAQDTAVETSPYCTSKPALASVTDLSGTWVVRMVGSQIVSPGFVSPFGTQSFFYLLMTIKQTGTDVVADGRYCNRIEIDSPKSIAPVTISEAWAHTEKSIHRTGTFAPVNDGTPVLNFTPSVEVAGAVINPSIETLPTSATDPRVIDEDGDGHPGITVTLSGSMVSGSLYSAQEQTTSVLAIAVAPDRVEGSLAFSSIQNVLGSNPASLSDPKSLVGAALTKPGTTTTDPVLCNSTFVMVKIATAPVGGGADGGGVDGGGVDGGTLSCEWVRANEDSLFAQ